VTSRVDGQETLRHGPGLDRGSGIRGVAEGVTNRMSADDRAGRRR
jgi:hypothetical protein